MNKRVIIDAGLTDERVAVIEAGRLVEIHIERIEDDKIVGNIYKGKVTNVLPGIEAAFVDIGIEKNAFLHNVSYNVLDKVCLLICLLILFKVSLDKLIPNA